MITKTRRSPAFAQYWRHAVQDRIGCYRRRQHLRRCNHQVSQGRGPCGRLLMARPAVLGCIWACGVKRRARAHAIMARVSRSEAASSLSRRSRARAAGCDDYVPRNLLALANCCRRFVSTCNSRYGEDRIWLVVPHEDAASVDLSLAHLAPFPDR